ncbi:C2 domain [Dillenia turbinata]|uniref:Phosphoinositide phospholipase C n=1 Tax=Dillenia turbinata TaxID=194707 RepID=A0AAN8VTX0_9MAGN
MSNQHYRVCFCFRLKFSIGAAEPPAEIRELFDSYSENSGTMSVDQFHNFLIDYQGEHTATKEYAQNIINSLKHLNIFHRRGLNLESFFRYLFSDDNLALSPSLGPFLFPVLVSQNALTVIAHILESSSFSKIRKWRLFPFPALRVTKDPVHHDMEAPLSHYFIYTGHNSYLTGNQLSSDCSVEPIVRALRRGVRVIELDIWPNSTNDDVEVRHGGTLTTAVKLIECLTSIKDNAFHASKYPVVITFEDHLSADLQAKVARMVTKTFGDMLFYPTAALTEFPSPEELKERIIISTKPPKEFLDSQSSKLKEKHSKEFIDSAGEAETETSNKPDLEEYAEEDIQNAVPGYKSLIAIHAGKPKGQLANALMAGLSKVTRLSLSEQELENAAKKHGTDIVRFTQRNLLRVYPKGTRVDSSNYNPLIGWRHGAQMVALNMQGYGKHLWVTHGMFRANGGCGYVKKPQFLLDVGPNNEVFDPNEELEVKTTLKVKVYIGDGWRLDFRRTAFDLYSPPDFYTKVRIVGVPADKKKKKTHVIEDQWVPKWNQEFKFPLTVPELALLQIEVKEYDPSGRNDFGGQTCLPLSELRPGIRSVPLNNRKGAQYKSVRLLMRFLFE